MRLVCVGRDFGFQEAAVGRPFVGPSGKLLTKAMALAGIDRSAPDVLITNVVNKRPRGDEWGAHAPADVAEGLNKLQQLLTLAKPDLIVALGEHALQAVTQGDPNVKPPKKQTITETRGYVFESAWGPTLAMVHPAFILRTWHPWWATFCYDWQKAVRRLRGEGVGRRGRERILGAGDALPWAELAEARALAVDIETTGTGAGCKPVCIAFAHSVEEGFAFPWADDWSGLAQELLELDVPKVFHNGQFDVTILERAGCHVTRWEEDTMILWHCVEPLLAGKQNDTGSRSEKSLRFLASLLTDEPFYKVYDFSSGSDEQMLLCAKDSRVTLSVWHALRKRLNASVETATNRSRSITSTGTPLGNSAAITSAACANDSGT